MTPNTSLALLSNQQTLKIFCLQWYKTIKAAFEKLQRENIWYMKINMNELIIKRVADVITLTFEKVQSKQQLIHLMNELCVCDTSR